MLIAKKLGRLITLVTHAISIYRISVYKHPISLTHSLPAVHHAGESAALCAILFTGICTMTSVSTLIAIAYPEEHRAAEV